MGTVALRAHHPKHDYGNGNVSSHTNFFGIAQDGQYQSYREALSSKKHMAYQGHLYQ